MATTQPPLDPKTRELLKFVASELKAIREELHDIAADARALAQIERERKRGPNG